jgi:hypothetical protein
MVRSPPRMWAAEEVLVEEQKWGDEEETYGPHRWLHEHLSLALSNHRMELIHDFKCLIDNYHTQKKRRKDDQKDSIGRRNSTRTHSNQVKTPPARTDPRMYATPNHVDECG